MHYAPIEHIVHTFFFSNKIQCNPITKQTEQNKQTNKKKGVLGSEKKREDLSN